MSTPITRRTVLAGTGAAALLSATGVSLADEHDDDDEDLEEDDPMFAAVNTVHASPDAPEVDVYVNGARVLEGVQFHDISDYLVMLEGEYQVQIVPVEDEEMDDDDNGIGDDDDDDDVGMDDDDDDVGMDDDDDDDDNGFGDDDDDDDNGFGDDDDDDDNGFGDDDDDDDNGFGDDDEDDNGFGDDDEVDLEEDAVIDEQIDVPAGVATAAVVGEVEEGAEQELELLVLDVDIDDLEDDESRVRAVHASPDAPDVDIVADDDPLVEGLGFGDYETVDVEEGEYSLEVREAGEDESVADFDVTLEAGVAYSAFAVGYLEEEDDDEDNGIGDNDNDNDNGIGDDDENDDNGFGDDDENDDNGFGDNDNGMGEDVDTGFDLLLNIDALTPMAEVEEMPEDEEDDEMDDDDDIGDDDEDNGIDDDDDDIDDDDDDIGDDDDDDDNGVFDDDDEDDDNGIGDDDDDDDNGVFDDDDEDDDNGI